MPFQKGHAYLPPASKKLPDDPLDLIESGLVKDMASKDDKARHAAYVIYLRLQSQRKNKRTVLEPIIEQLVSWLYSQAESQSIAIKDYIQYITLPYIDGLDKVLGVCGQSKLPILPIAPIGNSDAS